MNSFSKNIWYDVTQIKLAARRVKYNRELVGIIDVLFIKFFIPYLMMYNKRLEYIEKQKEIALI